MRVWAAVLLLACGSQDPEPAVSNGCADPLEIALPNGDCVRPGVPIDGCATGFVHDGEYGCEPVLPPERCPPGLMAVPGDSECRPVMACGRGRWGNIPIDASTVYVDASYVGIDSDGSAAKPWTTIGAAVAAAPPGALVAVAAGSYVESVNVTDKPLRLWGVCPDMAEIVGMVATACPASALCIARASGTEVRGLALRGSGHGIALSGSENVMVDSVRVHDTSQNGVYMRNDLGPTSVSIVDSLIEQTREVGVLVSAADAAIERTVVRGTLPADDQTFGCGVDVQLHCTAAGCDPSVRGRARIAGSIVEDNHSEGIFVMGSDVEIEGSVVRNTQPSALDQAFGRGIDIQDSCRVQATCDDDARSSAMVRGSLVDQNREAGVRVAASLADIAGTVIRGTLPRSSDMGAGRGINVQSCSAIDGCTALLRSEVKLTQSLVADNHDVGVMVGGSDIEVDAAVVRDTHPTVDQQSGHGFSIELACDALGVCDPTARANAAVRRSLVTRAHAAALLAATSDLLLEDSAIIATLGRPDGSFGDGVTTVSYSGAANATLTNVFIDESARAGVSNFGAHVAIESTHIQCSAFDVEGEAYLDQPFSFDDRGGNVCGCPLSDGPCIAVSAGLEAPAPIAAR